MRLRSSKEITTQDCESNRIVYEFSNRRPTVRREREREREKIEKSERIEIENHHCLRIWVGWCGWVQCSVCRRERKKERGREKKIRGEGDGWVGLEGVGEE
ncbi:hypothetical protein PRUPE_2G088000 [Prunus persica]|uniref:Uncharacterized protein n=1 Tax=Prunus persica TaxID=3760 RepID=A0A251QD55_PRUPE|nr:hypothetical protein PRUPE_2G088000 [Prunus persica]